MDSTPATDVAPTPRRRRPRRIGRLFRSWSSCKTTESCTPQPFVAMPAAIAAEGSLKTQAPIKCTKLAHGQRDFLREERKFPPFFLISARTLLSEVGAAASECGNSLGTPGTLSYEAPGSSNPKLC